MALFVKVRHTFGHRWMPFFLPVAASLLYVLLVVLLVPDSFTGKSKSGVSKDDDLTETPSASASAGTDLAARAAARRRPRVGARAAGAVAPQPGPPAPAPAAPASPDGND